MENIMNAYVGGEHIKITSTTGGRLQSCSALFDVYLQCVVNVHADVQLPASRRRLRVETQLRSSHAAYSALSRRRTWCRRARRLQQGQQLRICTR